MTWISNQSEFLINTVQTHAILGLASQHKPLKAYFHLHYNRFYGIILWDKFHKIYHFELEYWRLSWTLEFKIIKRFNKSTIGGESVTIEEKLEAKFSCKVERSCGPTLQMFWMLGKEGQLQFKTKLNTFLLSESSWIKGVEAWINQNRNKWIDDEQPILVPNSSNPDTVDKWTN